MADKFVIMEKPRYCDLCKEEKKQAIVDGQINGVTSWAYMCLEHWPVYGVGLGVGIGQVLFYVGLKIPFEQGEGTLTRIDGTTLFFSINDQETEVNLTYLMFMIEHLGGFA